MVFRPLLIRAGAAAAMVVAAAILSAQAPSVSENKLLLQQALRNSVLVEGHQPFHVVVEISPDTAPHAHARAVPASMHGTVELLWLNSNHYKLLLKSPSFNQMRIVDGPQVEEQNDGNFYPRWLDDFVKMLLNPVPKPQLSKLLQQRLSGGGTLSLPGRPAITMPRCLETSERPDGITDETSVARMCFDASHPWYQGTLDFTRYVSFADYAPFQGQMIARTWSDDIPENIFLEGKLTLLEPLKKSEYGSIHVSNPTPISGQIRTIFLSRKDIQDRIEAIPAFEWPPEDTEALEGYMIAYVRTDKTGQIRESYWDSSDNYKLQDAGVQLALKSKLNPYLLGGEPAQMEGPLVLHFKTKRSTSFNGSSE
jgi:hypothetical protein